MIYAAIATAIAFAPYSTDSHAMSLREAVDRTVHSNPNVGAMRAERNAIYYELQQSKGRFLPEISVEAEYGNQNSWHKVDENAPGQGEWTRRRQASFNASQILFDGWDRHYDVYKNEARLDAAASRVLERSQALGLDAVEAYIDVRRYRELAVLARNNVARHREIGKLVQTQFDGGRVPESDVSQITSRLSAAQSIEELNRLQSLETEARFRKLVGSEPVGLQRVALPNGLPRSVTEARSISTQSNPSVLAALSEAKAKAHEADQAASGFFPTISLEGDAVYGYETDAKLRDNRDVIGSVVLRWKLFDGLIRHNRRRELLERATQSRLQADARRIYYNELIEKAWAAYTTGRSRIEALMRQSAASGSVVNSFREEYEASKRTLIEVIDAETLYFNARFQLIGARSVQQFAAYQLLAGMGQLLNSLGVEPPPEVSGRDEIFVENSVSGFPVLFEPLR